MNMANYGIPQHRIRLIMQFTRKGVRAIQPEPTHEKYGRYGLAKWVPVRTCLDLADEGESALAFKKKRNKKRKKGKKEKGRKGCER